ncbi:MAG: Sua5/YciO/YrdC/YwlC family protein [Calditrichaceae bacterium]
MKQPITQFKTLRRKRITVNGIVQGVGFRPFVYTLAKKLNLTGMVYNSPAGVIIEIEGPVSSIREFKSRLLKDAPPLSDIFEIEDEIISVKNSGQFVIELSKTDRKIETLISPDVSICDDCLRELFDKSDRRYHYPFINCTNCGPRYTIIRTIPYDRPFTSMSNFKMCPNCQAEYDDPQNRRFHAQPNACPVCGPKVWYEINGSKQKDSAKEDAFTSIVKDILNGKIAAIKGLGGFHLAVDACNYEAVARLRQRKNREEKPLAIMVEDIKSAEKIAKVRPVEQKLLTGEQRPIVLLEKLNDINIAGNIAPGNKRLGVMLPYTPLHYVLFEHLKMQNPACEPAALVMTSANISEEGICAATSVFKIIRVSCSCCRRRIEKYPLSA